MIADSPLPTMRILMSSGFSHGSFRCYLPRFRRLLEIVHFVVAAEPALRAEPSRPGVDRAASNAGLSMALASLT